MEQGTTEQAHRGNIQGTPCFLAPRRGSCSEGQTTTASIPGSAGLPKGTLVGVRIASHLLMHLCTLCRIEYRQLSCFLFRGFGHSFLSKHICTSLEAHQDLNPAEPA